MDEASWLACTDPQKMLAFLRGKAGERKLRLFACACARSAWDRLTDPRSQAAVEAAERYADGQAAQADLRAAEGRAYRAQPSGGPSGPVAHPARVAWLSCLTASVGKPIWNRNCAERSGIDPGTQAALLRDLFGLLPFRPVPINPTWLDWDGGTIPKLAQAAYDNRSLPAGTLNNDRLAVLADALEESGCDDAALLGHLRSGGEHYRGCFAVDAVRSVD